MPSLLHDSVQGSHPSCTSLNNRNISGNTRDRCILAKSIFHKGKKICNQNMHASKLPFLALFLRESLCNIYTCERG